VQLERSELRAVLDCALAQLDVTERLILRLRFEGRVSVPEIARLLGSRFAVQGLPPTRQSIDDSATASRSGGDPRCVDLSPVAANGRPIRLAEPLINSWGAQVAIASVQLCGRNEEQNA
jgi:hypothetical protein